jgi:hypothetical protein
VKTKYDGICLGGVIVTGSNNDSSPLDIFTFNYLHKGKGLLHV